MNKTVNHIEIKQTNTWQFMFLNMYALIMYVDK